MMYILHAQYNIEARTSKKKKKKRKLISRNMDILKNMENSMDINENRKVLNESKLKKETLKNIKLVS